MSILNKVLLKVTLNHKDKKPNLIKDVMDKPEEFKLEAFIENDEVIIKIKRRES